MTGKTLLIGAAATALLPALASAAPGGNGSTSPGSSNGAGYHHMNGPAMTGQPDQDCRTADRRRNGLGPGQFGELGPFGLRRKRGRRLCRLANAELAQHGVGVAVRRRLLEPASIGSRAPGPVRPLRAGPDQRKGGTLSIERPAFFP